MERRTFMQATLASACAAGAGLAADAKPREFYELRVCSLKAEKQPVLDQYLGKALLPAAQRAGLGPVGVFTDQAKGDLLKVYVLLVAPSADALANLGARLADDAEYRKAAQEYLATPASSPVYTRIESSLLGAIAGMPKLARPDAGKPRLLNLRIYESHNERANQKKIEMFNQGELAIFRRTGLTPVFFGEALVGSALPNLTYLLVFPDDEGRKAAWAKFRDDPEWLKLKAIPEYADKEIVSKITNVLLAPTAYSEI